MKLQFIYISIGILTLVLNLVFTLHIIRKCKDTGQKEILGCDDIITFRLTGESSSDGDTTEAAFYDDTVALQ